MTSTDNDSGENDESAFETDANTLTGTIGGDRGESPIMDGTINGDEVTFRQQTGFGERKVFVIYSGKAAGDSIEFDRTTEGGAADSREMTFRAIRID